jgi:plasmid stabilization system protein ParE
MMKLELHPQVHSDILEIIEFYEEAAGVELAAEFYSEFRYYADQIASRPESFPVHVNQLRRCNLDKFPHHILYESVAEDLVQILVVKHDSRKPSFGLDR